MTSHTGDADDWSDYPDSDVGPHKRNLHTQDSSEPSIDDPYEWSIVAHDGATASGGVATNGYYLELTEKKFDLPNYKCYQFLHIAGFKNSYVKVQIQATRPSTDMGHMTDWANKDFATWVDDTTNDQPFIMEHEVWIFDETNTPPAAS